MKKIFKQNVGTLDKALRGLGGFLFAFLALKTPPFFSMIFVIIAIILFTTASSGFCLIYSAFGINTTKQTKDITENSKEKN